MTVFILRFFLSFSHPLFARFKSESKVTHFSEDTIEHSLIMSLSLPCIDGTTGGKRFRRNCNLQMCVRFGSILEELIAPCYPFSYWLPWRTTWSRLSFHSVCGDSYSLTKSYTAKGSKGWKASRRVTVGLSIRISSNKRNFIRTFRALLPAENV